MDRPDSRFMHEWHVAINRYNTPKRHERFMYEAKSMADEVPRMAMLFKAERSKELPEIHQQCSLSEPEQVIDNHLSCCLGTKCAKCPILLSLNEIDNRSPEEIDIAKAWTCAAHIVSEGGDMMNEGYILTVADRMYWNNVYDSLGDTKKPDESQA